MQKTVLLFGAGKSATALIHYLLNEATSGNWKVLIADANKKLILSKITDASHAEAVEINIYNAEHRAGLIKQSDIVISLMPPSLHFLVAKDCVEYGKNLLTASYIDDDIKSLEPEIKRKELLFLCEMGLDPGIDHISAMHLIDSIHAKGGTITSFKSHCGGLVAPESDDNPWHYKISWNPKNIVMAGKGGAVYKRNGKIIEEKYEDLFDENRKVHVPTLGFLSYYPNRNSLDYSKLYNLQEAKTFMRTTLRHKDFMEAWRTIVDLKLTDTLKKYETDGVTLADFFKEYLMENDFEALLHQAFFNRYPDAEEMFQHLKNATEKGDETSFAENLSRNLMLIKDDGFMSDINMEAVKIKAALLLSKQMNEAGFALAKLSCIGFDDYETFINKGYCSAADIIQFALETKLALKPTDKDMVVMLHEIAYTLNNEQFDLQSSLVVKGENAVNTAMAKTVGLPLGIAAKLILNDKIQLKGLQIPVKKAIYLPVLEELKIHGIRFVETS